MKISGPRRPPVIAYHLIWTVYGTWLPNDPRGSGSHNVVSPWLAELGETHLGRKRVQPASKTIRTFYERAEPRLVHPVIRFNEPQFPLVADALGDAIREYAYSCYACAIMPDHVHLVIRKHRDLAETMIDHLQAATRLRLSTATFIPPDHPVWTLKGWHAFLSSPKRVREVIQYVADNPTKIALPRQHWAYITPYDNWPFHKR